MVRITYGWTTDRGDIRTENQDSILCLTETVEQCPAALFLIADGMGGLSYGSQVSRYIVSQFEQWWHEDFPQMVLAGRTSKEDMKELLEQEIWDINQAVLRFKEEAGCRSGSTLSLLFLYNGFYQITNIGDSRVYLLRDGSLERLTEDQSLAAQMVREKRMTEEEARHSKEKHVLTMCIGMFQTPRSFSVCGDVKSGDLFLLCSDGLYNPLEEKQIKWVLTQPGLSAQKRAHYLRNMIEWGDASDNVSIIVAEAR